MYDLYDQSALAVAKHKTLPTGAPLIAWSDQLGVMLENGTHFKYVQTVCSGQNRYLGGTDYVEALLSKFLGSL